MPLAAWFSHPASKSIHTRHIPRERIGATNKFQSGKQARHTREQARPTHHLPDAAFVAQVNRIQVTLWHPVTTPVNIAGRNTAYANNSRSGDVGRF